MNTIDKSYSEIEQRLLNDFQQGLPLSPTPYADLAKQLGVDETTVLDSLHSLQDQNIVSRVGAVFRPNRVGVSTLAAIAVPKDDLENVAQIVSSFNEVNHNYEREDVHNLWFVVVATDREKLDQVIAEIEQQSGYRVMDLPMVEDYFIDLGFNLRWT